MATSQELAVLNDRLMHGNLLQRADAADRLAKLKNEVSTDFIFTVHDKFWNAIGEPGRDLMESSGTDPHNNVPQATMKLKGSSSLVGYLMACRETLVGLTVETAGLRMAFYVDTHSYKYQNSTWTSTSECKGIWDVLSYMIIWPMWFMPIQAQLFSHAVFVGPLVTVIENMISECALRIQSGIWEFINNALSLNPDVRAWFGTLLQSNGNIFQMLKTPVYVVRTNPFFDTSPLYVKTVRMESCGKVITEITRPYGVDVQVNLWKPGDAQPDPWANLTQPTYVVTVKDRSSVQGPTGTIIDSVLRTVVDVAGSFFGNQLSQGQYSPDGVFTAPMLGLNFVMPYALVVAPEPGEKSPLIEAEIVDHTPKGWRQIVGGKSPKWLNDLINATLAWLIDSIMIIVGFTGLPSNLLDGFLNDSFLAFQLIDNYDRRNAMGPYHPAMEVFTPTGSSPYNVETIFTFINQFFDTRGYTSAIVKFRNGESLALGREVFRGGLFSLVYLGRTKIFTDYVELILWRYTTKEREVMIQVSDGRGEEAPLAKVQRLATGVQEAVNVLTMAPRS